MQKNNLNYFQIRKNVRNIYNDCLRLLETESQFNIFHRFFHLFGIFFDSPPLQNGDIECAPIVMILGQTGVGKTTMINYLLEKPYVGSLTAEEHEADKFHAVVYGEREDIIPGFFFFF
jgi:Cdc6-like AAA superfamily ATPase